MAKQHFISIPPFNFLINSNIPSVSKHVDCIYGNHEKLTNTPENFIDFNVNIVEGSGLRKLIKPQSRFFSDDNEPFVPLPYSQAHAFLEWGMNWCVASSEANWLVIHSAILAKDDKAIIFPAPPGSGKSTLTAYLSQKGWRLLSDEMTIVELNTVTAIPFVRAISLKNNSIDLVKKWFPDIVMSDVAKDTQKGDVAHVKPPKESVKLATQKAQIVGIVFPQYQADTVLDIYELEQTDTFMQLASNSFNYNVIGADAFTTIGKLVDECPGYEIKYNDLSEVEAFLNEDILGL